MKIDLVNEKAKKIGINLPDTRINEKNMRFQTITKCDDLLFLSGQGPLRSDGTPFWQGKVGNELTLEEGYIAARDTGVIVLEALHDYLGGFEQIDSFVKVLGWISSADDFYLQPKVMNGFSDLINDVLGEKGLHSRSAIGTNVLPFNIPIEIELIVKVKTN